MSQPARIAAVCDEIAATVARTISQWPVKPALPRMPADLLAECARAAGICTTQNPENEQ
jgi:hypothetical protein